MAHWHKRAGKGRRMGLRKKEGEAAWRPIALLWARSNLMEDKGRLHTHLPPWHTFCQPPPFCLHSLLLSLAADNIVFTFGQMNK